jgi:hypothetical protein
VSSIGCSRRRTAYGHPGHLWRRDLSSFHPAAPVVDADVGGARDTALSSQRQRTRGCGCCGGRGARGLPPDWSCARIPWRKWWRRGATPPSRLVPRRILWRRWWRRGAVPPLEPYASSTGRRRCWSISLDNLDLPAWPVAAAATTGRARATWGRGGGGSWR